MKRLKPECPYKILGVDKTATKAEIARSYRLLVLEWHPDRNGQSKEANARTVLINDAHRILGDAEKRALYDEFGFRGLVTGFDAEHARRAARAPEATERTRAATSRASSAASRAPAARAPVKRAPGVADSVLPVVLRGDSARQGTKVPIRALRERECDGCHGQGRVPRPCLFCSGTGGLDQPCGTCLGFKSIIEASEWKWRTCDACAGRGVSSTAQACSACNATGSVDSMCPSCWGTRRSARFATITVTVPPGTEHGQYLRVAGQGFALGSDLYLHILVAA